MESFVFFNSAWSVLKRMTREREDGGRFRGAWDGPARRRPCIHGLQRGERIRENQLEILGKKKNPEAPLPPPMPHFPRSLEGRTTGRSGCEMVPGSRVKASRRGFEKNRDKVWTAGSWRSQRETGGMEGRQWVRALPEEAPRPQTGKTPGSPPGVVITVVRVRAVTVATAHASEHRPNQNTIPVTRNKGKKWRGWCHSGPKGPLGSRKTLEFYSKSNGGLPRVLRRRDGGDKYWVCFLSRVRLLTGEEMGRLEAWGERGGRARGVRSCQCRAFQRLVL